uniref:Signal peptidase complex catalytic subunit SEC11 n=1 Tax=Mycena chlorophos TaxID=658473 RepID=A0ABQ0MD98_MYCCL|nr:predicted protein [Mycena chlorophos]
MLPSRIRRALLEGLLFASSLSSSYMAYAAAEVLTNCKSPIVVVLSGSMEPGIHRGDLLLLSNWTPNEYTNGDIAVYEVPGQAESIVHRVLETRDPKSNSRRYLTKGDNNEVDDLSLYNGMQWLEAEHLVGKVYGIVPYVGYISIYMKAIPGLNTTKGWRENFSGSPSALRHLAPASNERTQSVPAALNKRRTGRMFRWAFRCLPSVFTFGQFLRGLRRVLVIGADLMRHQGGIVSSTRASESFP